MFCLSLALFCSSVVPALVLQIPPTGPLAPSSSGTGIPFVPETANLSLLSPPSARVAGAWNETPISAFNASGGPRPAPPHPLFRPGSCVCNGTLFGRGLNPSSCLQAWTLIPPLEREQSFGPRFPAPIPPGSSFRPDVTLPRRYLSCRRYAQKSLFRIPRC